MLLHSCTVHQAMQPPPTCMRPSATMADSAPYTSGVASTPPMLPMLLSVSVPPITSSCGSRPAAANPYGLRTRHIFSLARQPLPRLDASKPAKQLVPAPSCYSAAFTAASQSIPA